MSAHIGRQFQSVTTTTSKCMKWWSGEEKYELVKVIIEATRKALSLGGTNAAWCTGAGISTHTHTHTHFVRSKRADDDDVERVNKRRRFYLLSSFLSSSILILVYWVAKSQFDLNESLVRNAAGSEIKITQFTDSWSICVAVFVLRWPKRVQARNDIQRNDVWCLWRVCVFSVHLWWWRRRWLTQINKRGIYNVLPSRETISLSVIWLHTYPLFDMAFFSPFHSIDTMWGQSSTCNKMRKQNDWVFMSVRNI